MPKDAFYEAALEYHRRKPPGKIKVAPTKPLVTQRDLALAYSPGVAAACEAIVEDENAVSEMTARGNLVAVVSNGTAVLGLGDIGPLASKPVMEGKGVLFQKFAGIDVFDIEVNENDPDKLVDIIASLEPTFGGINLEDIKAPECFIVEKKLRERMNIPVFHDDQHGTAIIVGAALVNALEVVGKDIKDVTLACSGAGAAGIACLDMLVALGLPKENITVVDRHGVVYPGRAEEMDEAKLRYARDTDKRTLGDIVDGADVFLGLSAGNILKPEMIEKMNDKPVILALANPTPEIDPKLAKQVRPDAIIATGRSDHPNQVNNALCFPYIFRGALDVGATTINEAMKLACVHAIAKLARMEATDLGSAYAGEMPVFGPEYLIPRPFDPRLLVVLAPAVAKAAMDSGIATRPMASLEAYEEKLNQFVFRTGLLMKPVFDQARMKPQRVVYAEGEEENVLRAVQTVVDEGLAFPVLIGRPEVINSRIKRCNLRLEAGKDFEMVNINDDPRFDDYWKLYHELTKRKGITPSNAKAIVRSRSTVIASLMLRRGEVDAMICGLVGRYQRKLHYVQEIIELDEGISSPSAMSIVLNEMGTWFFLDTHVQLNPSAEQIAEATMQAAYRLKLFGVEPRVALLSHSNFGSHDDEQALKMVAARELLNEKAPYLQVEGEMHPDAALNAEVREWLFPGGKLQGKANMFVMPNLDAATISYNLLVGLTDGVGLGPILMGFNKPAHILTPTSSIRRIINMTAMAAVEAQIRQGRVQRTEDGKAAIVND